MNQGWVPNTTPGNARWFGTGIHLCKAEWYIPGFERGRNMHETWDEYAKDSYAKMRVSPTWGDEDDKKYVDANDLAHAMIDGHLRTYGVDPSWEVIGAEMPFDVLIPHPLIPGRAIVKYVGTIDLVIRDHDKPTHSQIWLDDTKTAAKIYTHHLTLLEQPAAYVACGTFALRQQGKIGPKERIRGIIFDFMRKAYPDERPRNEKGEATNKPNKKHYVAAILGITPQEVVETKGSAEINVLMKKKLEELVAITEGTVVLGDVSADQGSPLFLRHEIEKTPAEMKRQLQRIGEEALVMRKVRSGQLPILKTPQDDCTFCDFFPVCELHESGGDWDEMLKMAYHKQDNYADHRSGAINSKTSVKNKVKTGVK